MAGVVETTNTFATNDVITSTAMNNIIDQTLFTEDAISGGTLAVISGKLKVATSGITSNEMAVNSVTTNTIADSAITNAKISASAAIGLSKLATGALPSAITVVAANISNDAVTQLKIGPNTVGRGPLTRVYLTGTQILSSGTAALVLFNNENYDTNNDFSTSTRRFTASVAGYYCFSATIGTSVAVNNLLVSLYLNGSVVTRGSQVSNAAFFSTLSDMFYLAVGDFVEVYAISSPGSTLYHAIFSAVMVRSGAN